MPRLTPSEAVGAWSPDWPALLLALLLAVGFSAGVRRAARRGQHWSWLRLGCFGTGLLVLVTATCGPPGAYSHTGLWMYVIRVCLLVLVAPLLLGAAAPVALAAAAWDLAGPRGEVARGLGRRLLAVVRLPGLGALLLIVVTALLFFTPWLGAALAHPLVLHVTDLALLATGLLLALPVTDEGTALSSVGYAAVLGLGLVEFALDALPGIWLRLQPHLVAAGYWLHVRRPWGLSPIADQHLAGDWLWFFGEAADLPFLIALVVAWIRADAREAVAIDRQLDQQAAALSTSASASTSALTSAAPESQSPTTPVLMRPWWESDPSVLGPARARQLGLRHGPDASEFASGDPR